MTYKVAFQSRESVYMYEYHRSESGYRIVRHESDEKHLFVGLCGHDKNSPAECD